MPELLEADDVVNVLPDHTRDRHRPHEAHHDDALAFQLGNVFTATAGLPATTVFGGTDLVTTDPAATTEFSPIVTPFKMVAFMPIQTLSEIFTGAVFNLG